MAFSVGTVECIRINVTFSFLAIKESTTGMRETFTLWVNGDEESAFTRILQSMWLSILRDSLVSGTKVRIGRDSSGLVDVVEMTK